jgi:FkbH-like protein
MRELKYSEILKINNKFEKTKTKKKFNVALVSNITVDVLKEIFEYSLRSKGITNAKVQVGNFNNIIQDSSRIKKSDVVIIFWEISEIIDSFQYRIDNLTDKEINELANKVKSEIDIVINNLKKTKIILFNKFSGIVFSRYNYKKSNLEKFCNILNSYLEKNIKQNFVLIDIEKIIADSGIKNSIDFRFYYSAKSLYSIDFFKNYSEQASSIALSFKGKSKKAIIMDCDNTLWSGILGEDGYDKIDMSKNSDVGKIFYEIQNIIIKMSQMGIIIGMCSKNNLKDVNRVISKHPDMLIKDKHLSIKKINWSNKAQNLSLIAKELNIGIDSLVFVDDSIFEINLIKKMLPEVTTIKVPKNLYEYPEVLNRASRLFYNFSTTKEDYDRGKMYKQQNLRNVHKNKFNNIDSYIKSLNLEINVQLNNKKQIPRISQMTQKTNQFNLTTKRKTENKIAELMSKKNNNVYTISVKDKFGDYGVTGLCILNLNKMKKEALIETFLLSCRVIGRDVEYAFMDYLVKSCNRLNLVKKIKGEYIKTNKNIIVKDFYLNCSFKKVKSNNSFTNYILDINSYSQKKINYIKVKND